MADVVEIPAGERAYREIRRRIVSLELKPNQAIGEVFLADELRMSRTPIREALTRLSGEGLVDFRARAGTIVAPIRLEAVRTAQYVREKLELAIIEEAALTQSNRAIFNIRQTIEEQRFSIAEGDTVLFFSADERMHRCFSEMVGRGPVWTIISEAKRHMDRLRRLSLQDTDLNQLLIDHENILAAIEGGNVADARSVLKIHLGRVMEDIDRLSSQYKDYFSQSEHNDAEIAQ
ncbi:GntR family transcriptional regulator [Labrenzia sp. DG1229]|uniref:GntR family transcriptional regulator n=1 Tax=Labrenzia sp. DG1229 TaxID=681847 RepID=UPI00068A5713|nr:GntR family transcriptional regulator [Labrenzia sp. DG1229]